MDNILYSTGKGHWGTLENKAAITRTRIQSGFYIPITWEGCEEDGYNIAISGMLTQFLFTPDEVTIHEMTEASLDSDYRHTDYWIFFDDGSRIQVSLEGHQMNEYPGYLIKAL